MARLARHWPLGGVLGDRCRQIIEGVAEAEISSVAAGATGLPVTLVGKPSVTALTAVHAARQTIGVVKVLGRARSSDGLEHDWSSVAKLVDLREEPEGWTQWTRPEIEETVYEEHYFSGVGSRFRPANCYGVTRTPDGASIFWLEDLTEARRQPFSVDELAQMATHLGEWNGRYLAPPTLKFGLPSDIFDIRVNLPVFLKTYALSKEIDPAVFAPYYRDVPLETLHEFRTLVREQNERTKLHPHGLAFGDCQLGNLFARDGDTIAVDWTSLASEPVGADGGAMIGSAFTWGTGVAEVARHEDELFEAYLAGLKAGGWRGTRDDVRRGYFCQFGHYLATGIGLMPVLMAYEIWPRADMEKRLGVPADEIADLLAPIVAMLPRYVEELRALAD
jgi:hypothetical protein